MSLFQGGSNDYGEKKNKNKIKRYWWIIIGSILMAA